ncbi:MAG TPA: signal peptide peptidase SppA [Verrucomicrobiae bacterium]|nr:signal peptide peptidase SppA [Verrucomicrobiae bacterium]
MAQNIAQRFFVRLLATIGAVVLLGAVLGAACVLVVKRSVPTKVILEVDLEKRLAEYTPDDPVARIVAGRAPTILNLVEALQRGSTDKRVVGLIARVGEAGLPLADIQEIRDAVVAFRHSGKPAIAYAETFGEESRANGSYYLATAFDRIYLQPSGDVGLSGLMAETPFLRGTLDKLGLVPRMDHRSEYKNAMNELTEKKYTPAHREATEAFVKSAFDQLVAGIASARKMSTNDVRALIDRGPFLADEALDAKLVDKLGYRDAAYDDIKKQAGPHTKFLYLSKYLDRAGSPYDEGDTVALIYGVGDIHRGKSGYSPLFQDVSMGADSVAAAFRAAAEDKDVKAILFRIDSGGGSYVASDTIWRETVRARKAGKPIIVSMGGVAGSGGYFIAMSADKIVAQPATLTGSIGVFAGKFLTTNFWDKLGISWDEVHTSSNAMVFTGLQDYTPEQWTRFEGWLDRIYDDFTTKVAAGRKLPKDKVLEIAKGRIWIGEDAKALGLVDELGGFPVALKLVREAAKLPLDAKIKLKLFPRPQSPIERLLGRGSDSSESAGDETLARTLELIQPFARAARQLGLAAESDMLRMPDVNMDGP